MVKVKVYSTLREICGKEFEIDAGSVKELLSLSCKKYGKDFKKQVRSASLLVNGKNISYLQGLKTPLKKDDEVSILPPAAGGMMDARRIQHLMRQMKMSMEEIKAEEVIIKTKDKDLIFEKPVITVVSAPGVGRTYQIIGTPREQKKFEIKDEDVAIVRAQTGASEEEARKALLSAKGDLAEAIMRLKEDV
jgi:nascent polypeptide-associated complex subunit alpha